MADNNDAELIALRAEVRAEVRGLEKVVDMHTASLSRHSEQLDALRGIREEVASLKTGFLDIRTDLRDSLTKLREDMSEAQKTNEQRRVDSADLDNQLTNIRLMKVTIIVTTLTTLVLGVLNVVHIVIPVK